MAYNFFTIAASGGSNANAGSTSSVIYTSASAVWDGVSAISGISGAGAVNVGDWINVNSVYVAQVTINGTTSLTLSTVAKYGTAPTAGTYTINDGGAWASTAAWTAILGTTTVYNSTCLQF